MDTSTPLLITPPTDTPVVSSPSPSVKPDSLSVDEIFLPEDFNQAVEAAAKILWSEGLGTRLAKDSSAPFTEDIDLRLGNRRDGVGSDYAKQAATTPWSSVSEAIYESNWSYVNDSCDSALRLTFDDMTGWRGELQDITSACQNIMSERDEDFDSEAFMTAVFNEVAEYARDKGVDRVFEVVPKLGGSCGARLNTSYDLLRGPCDDDKQAPMVPNFIKQHSSRDWAEALSFLNIHPADFANAVRKKVLSELSSDEYWATLGPKNRSERAQIKRETHQELTLQGLNQPVGHNPLTWTGGMHTLAEAWAAEGSSLPPVDSKPAVSIDEFIDILSTQHGEVDFELTFDAEGETLQSHSELIDRFNAKSPLCGELLAQQTLIISSGTLTISDADIAFAGPVATRSIDISFSDETYDHGYLDGCMSESRSQACQADELAWLMRDNIHTDPDTHKNNLKRVGERATALAWCKPQAFSWALHRANELNASSDAVKHAEVFYTNGLTSRNKREVKLGKNSTTVDTPLIHIDHFDVRHGALMNAPWRLSITPALAAQCDSLGNTLAHKACAISDTELLAFALQCEPSLADKKNIAGIAPIDLIHHANVQASYCDLVLALLKYRPDLANVHALSGRTFLDLCAARSPSTTSLSSLLDAGCSMSTLNTQGHAPWSHWIHKNATDLATLLAPAIARGWRIDEQDRHGQGLTHSVRRLDSAQILLVLGADFGKPNATGLSGGCLLQPQDFATLELEILAAAQPAPVMQHRLRSRSL